MNRNPFFLSNMGIPLGVLILGFSFIFLGCDPHNPQKTPQHDHSGHDHHDHDEHGHGGGHHHTAPHGGTLLVLGEELSHVELQLEESSGKLTAWALDGEAEKAIRLKQETLELEVRLNDQKFVVELKGVEDSLTGEKLGDTSQFEGQSDKLKGVKKFEGTLKMVHILGQEYKNIAFPYPEGNESLMKEAQDNHDDHDDHDHDDHDDHDHDDHDDHDHEGH